MLSSLNGRIKINITVIFSWFENSRSTRSSERHMRVVVLVNNDIYNDLGWFVIDEVAMKLITHVSVILNVEISNETSD